MKYNYGSEPLHKGDRVKVVSLTDVDTGEPEDQDELGLIGKVGTVVEPVICDYYDCHIQFDSLGEIGKVFGDPPVLAFLYCDIEKVAK